MVSMISTQAETTTEALISILMAMASTLTSNGAVIRRVAIKMLRNRHVAVGEALEIAPGEALEIAQMIAPGEAPVIVIMKVTRKR